MTVAARGTFCSLSRRCSRFAHDSSQRRIGRNCRFLSGTRRSTTWLLMWYVRCTSYRPTVGRAKQQRRCVVQTTALSFCPEEWKEMIEHDSCAGSRLAWIPGGHARLLLVLREDPRGTTPRRHHEQHGVHWV